VHEIGQEVIAPAAIDVDAAARFPDEAFAALREEGLLGAYVPRQFGGMGLSMTEVSRVCEVMGHYCASTAMVFAMHQIQVACLAHHHGSQPFHRSFLAEVADRQLLLASATTELGTGGDLGSSVCAVLVDGDSFSLDKQAPVISYGLEADAILVTARSGPEASGNDQVHVVVRREDTELEEIAGWDTLGFRGTRSLGFRLRATGGRDQILPVPFSEILAHSMHPFSHMVWGSLWLGLATDAVNRARGSLRSKMRKGGDPQPVTALRLAEVDERLFEMRNGLYNTIDEYEKLLTQGDADAFTNYGFAIRVNNVKITCSELLVDIVGKALQIVGISGYKNDSSASLCRHLRDAYGAALMVNNDRIRGYNATMQVVYRGA
jgi:acyl-CoA dehydrogenase